MSKKIKFICLVLIIITVTSLVSCSLFEPKHNAFYGGQIIDKEMMESLKADVLSTESEEEENSSAEGPVYVRPGGTTKPASPETENRETAPEVQETENQESFDESSHPSTTEPEFSDSTVFWTESGGVWHLFNNCSHLKRSKMIYYGTVEEAIEAGKEKVCSTCAKKVE